MTTRGGSGKAWAAAHLFPKEEEPVRDERPENGVAGAAGTDGWLGQLRLGESRREGRLEIVSLLRDGDGGEPGVLLTLQKGRLVAIFEALTGAAPEERLVAAPGALLAVRGTRYGVETTSDGESVVAVFEGTVEVRSSLPGVAPIAVHAQEF